MENNTVRGSLIGLLIIAVCNFQKFSDRSFGSSALRISTYFYLEIILDCKM